MDKLPDAFWITSFNVYIECLHSFFSIYFWWIVVKTVDMTSDFRICVCVTEGGVHSGHSDGCWNQLGSGYGLRGGTRKQDLDHSAQRKVIISEEISDSLKPVYNFWDILNIALSRWDGRWEAANYLFILTPASSNSSLPALIASRGLEYHLRKGLS